MEMSVLKTTNNRKRDGTRLITGFLLITILILAGITLYPFVLSFYNSFHTYILYKPYIGKPFVGLHKYIDLVTSAAFLHSFRVTLIYASLSITGTILFGLLLALLLVKEDGLRKSILAPIFSLPFFVPPVVTAFAFRFMYNPRAGIISHLLSFIGVNVDSVLGDPSIALYAVILADIWSQTPIAFLILLAGLKSIPIQLYDAARIDGASPLQLFRFVMLPLLKKVFLVLLLFRTMDAFKAFDLIYIMTGGGPGDSTEVLNLLGYKLGFAFYRMGSASAFSILMFVLIMILSTVYIRLLTTKE